MNGNQSKERVMAYQLAKVITNDELDALSGGVGNAQFCVTQYWTFGINDVPHVDFTCDW